MASLLSPDSVSFNQERFRFPVRPKMNELRCQKMPLLLDVLRISVGSSCLERRNGIKSLMVDPDCRSPLPAKQNPSIIRESWRGIVHLAKWE